MCCCGGIQAAAAGVHRTSAAGCIICGSCCSMVARERQCDNSSATHGLQLAAAAARYMIRSARRQQSCVPQVACVPCCHCNQYQHHIHMSNRRAAVAGCTAGLVPVLALHPLDVIKTRLQGQRPVTRKEFHISSLGRCPVILLHWRWRCTRRISLKPGRIFMRERRPTPALTHSCWSCSCRTITCSAHCMPAVVHQHGRWRAKPGACDACDTVDLEPPASTFWSHTARSSPVAANFWPWRQLLLVAPCTPVPSC